jgi:hypothetical protein
MLCSGIFEFKVFWSEWQRHHRRSHANGEPLAGLQVNQKDLVTSFPFSHETKTDLCAIRNAPAQPRGSDRAHGHSQRDRKAKPSLSSSSGLGKHVRLCKKLKPHKCRRWRWQFRERADSATGKEMCNAAIICRSSIDWHNRIDASMLRAQ